MATQTARDVVLSQYASSLIRCKARQLCRRPDFSRSDEDDLKQEMTLHLLLQTRHFDPRRGAMNTFINRVVNSCVAMILRDRRRVKRLVDGDLLSLERTMVQVNGTSIPASEAISEEDLSRRSGAGAVSDAARREDIEAIQTALGNLCPQHRDLCRRLTAGTVTSVARDLGTSRRQIRRALDVIRPHFLQAGFGN